MLKFISSIRTGSGANATSSPSQVPVQTASGYAQRQIQGMETGVPVQHPSEHAHRQMHDTERDVPVQPQIMCDSSHRELQDSQKDIHTQTNTEHAHRRIHNLEVNIPTRRSISEHANRRGQDPERDFAIAQLKSELERYKRELEKEKHSGEQLRKFAEQQRQARKDMQEEVAYWKGEMHRLRQGRDSARAELKQLEFQFDQAMKERQSIQALSEQRRLELEDAQSYLNTADEFSEQDVVRLIKNLNSEVFQVVRAVADSFQMFDTSKRDERAESEAAANIGPSMLELFQSVSDTGETLALETALQHNLVLLINDVITLWNFRYGDNVSVVMAGLNQKILRSESQSIAGRWRAITHRNMPSQLPDGRDWQDYCVEHSTSLLSSISMAAGGRVDVSGQADSIREIIHGAFRLRKMIGENIVGSNYTVTIGQSGDVFTPDFMEDAFALRGRPPKTGMSILCASELGLLRLDKVKASADAAGGISEVVILKPKVVLADFVMELGLGERSHGDNLSDSPMRE
ncbi:uncharacterized protein LAESUDRAFT_727115 [Laetiporus sulphureus 93-53]|uniref:Uncharacterized protein n=1 Tax=Laetiporus sulphureus 93-53 TaxID=1314785 RepID=A0A165DRF5_9APHY|nr:uncharacterized protein LAESUDRAFT_727115 [Laetiporus sulphureus 93-53]KZT05470.1 hypothetical protein LAESUDRAFT_727115 [Laetiporus sulphureus 93-53]